ncbi:MAG TPA: FliM/FliN family flagellar motor switch protein [Gammaproteobacteria bacterium]|nr:FliM/FliN family flagellar motor switch protein [Gammaproteobacteria bacterium]
MPRSAIVHTGKVESADLTAPGRVVRGRMPAIDAIQDRFARQVRLALFSYLRSSGCQISDSRTRFAGHDEVLKDLGPRVFLSVVDVSGLKSLALVGLDRNLVGAVVDQLCGATEPGGEFPGDFSPMELSVGHRLLELVLESVAHAWQPIVAIHPQVVRVEQNTSLIAIADSQEMLVVMQCAVSIAAGGGAITFAVPYTSIEHLRERLSSPASLAETRADEAAEWQHSLNERLDEVGVSLHVEIAGARVPLASVRDARVGSVIPIRVRRRALVRARGTIVAEAAYGERNGELAIRVGRLADDRGNTHDGRETGESRPQQTQQVRDQGREPEAGDGGNDQL